MEFQRFNGKVLLFGEYTVIDGGDALAIPLAKTFGQLSYNKENSASNRVLRDFAHYILQNEIFTPDQFDYERFKADVEKGVALESNAPIGYGVGSSGIMTAAIFHNYYRGKEHLGINILLEIFGRLESFFHGKSSGFDPLVSFLNYPLHIFAKKIEILDQLDKEILDRFYLIDTGTSRETAPLVASYKNSYKEEPFRMGMDQLSLLVTQAISSIIEGDQDLFANAFKEISAIEFEYLANMIPKDMVPLWQEGLKTKDCMIKLCGAGGGGYMLAYCKDIIPELSFPVVKVI